MDISGYSAMNEVQRDHWWYAARRQILDRVVHRVVREEGVPDGVIYDLGCGVGANLPVLEKYGPVMGVDMSEEAVEFCKAQGMQNVRQADLDNLDGIEPGSGSVVLLGDVIEHLDDEAPCLRAARKALAPGGALIVTVPAYMFLWSPADDLYHHRRRYTAGRLKRVIEPLFEIEHLTYFNTLLFGLVLAGRAYEKVMQRRGDDGMGTPREPVNGILRRVFSAESAVVPRRSLPFGVSILCVARKPK